MLCREFVAKYMAENEKNKRKEEEEEKEASNEEEAGPHPRPRVTLSSATTARTLEKMKRFFFSKEEWETYLMERMEERNGREVTGPQHESVVAWLNAVFVSQEDADAFLSAQLAKLQSERRNRSALKKN